MKTSKSLMKQRTPWFVLALLSLSLLVLGISGCERPASDLSTNQASTSSPTPCPKDQSPKDQLVDASKAAGVNIHVDEVFGLSRGAETVTSAPIAGWEKIPATALAKGVDFGFAYISTEEPRVPAGYYTMRGFADVTSVGTVKGRVQLVDRGGNVAAELPSEVEVHSLTVPAEAANARSFVTATNVGDRILFWHRCPNGVCIRVPIFVPRRFPIPGPIH